MILTFAESSNGNESTENIEYEETGEKLLREESDLIIIDESIESLQEDVDPNASINTNIVGNTVDNGIPGQDNGKKSDEEDKKEPPVKIYPLNINKSVEVNKQD